MSPVEASFLVTPCTWCSAKAGELCRSVFGRELERVHQARVLDNLFEGPTA